MRKVCSSTTGVSFTRCISVCPAPERAAQRRTEATQSAAVTPAPSENFKPSRKVNV
jgi:hypothetical protein